MRTANHVKTVNPASLAHRAKGVSNAKAAATVNAATAAANAAKARAATAKKARSL